MSVRLKDYHITDMIFNAATEELTFNFVVDGEQMTKVCIGYSTDEDAANALKSILCAFYAE